MNELDFLATHLRRDFLRRTLAGMGTLALTQLLGASSSSALPTPAANAPTQDPLAPKPPHFAPKAKNVIFLFQEGAPSQMDLF
ncbi:MAG: DUF1501 domain-containing protein, partial [Bryobacterales bacterium]|nr:DUF1501 domain-containing protein [Bryobacterales bacterium]